MIPGLCHPLNALRVLPGLCHPLNALLHDFAHLVQDTPPNDRVVSRYDCQREMAAEQWNSAGYLGIDLLSQLYDDKIMSRPRNSVRARHKVRLMRVCRAGFQSVRVSRTSFASNELRTELLDVRHARHLIYFVVDRRPLVRCCLN